MISLSDFKIFTEWMLALDRHFTVQKKKKVFIVDNCPSNSSDVRFTSLKLKFILANAKSILQPCD